MRARSRLSAASAGGSGSTGAAETSGLLSSSTRRLRTAAPRPAAGGGGGAAGCCSGGGAGRRNGLVRRLSGEGSNAPACTTSPIPRPHGRGGAPGAPGACEAGQQKKLRAPGGVGRGRLSKGAASVLLQGARLQLAGTSWTTAACTCCKCSFASGAHMPLSMPVACQATSAPVPDSQPQRESTQGSRQRTCWSAVTKDGEVLHVLQSRTSKGVRHKADIDLRQRRHVANPSLHHKSYKAQHRAQQRSPSNNSCVRMTGQWL